MGSLFGSMLASTAVGLGKQAQKQEDRANTNQDALNLLKERKKIDAVYEGRIHARNLGEATAAGTVKRSETLTDAATKRKFKAAQAILDRKSKEKSYSSKTKTDKVTAAKAITRSATDIIESPRSTDAQVSNAMANYKDAVGVLRAETGLKPLPGPLLYDKSVTQAQINKYIANDPSSHDWNPMTNVSASEAKDSILSSRKAAAAFQRSSPKTSSVAKKAPNTRKTINLTRDEYVTKAVKLLGVSPSQASAQYNRDYQYGAK